MAKELRELMNTLNTHEAIDKDDIEDDLDRFDMKMEELNCIRTRQLGAQMNAQVALCADYRSRASRSPSRTSSSWTWRPPRCSRSTPSPSAQGRRGCGAARSSTPSTPTSAGSLPGVLLRLREHSQWDNALRNCNDALELNPSDEGVLYQKASSSGSRRTWRGADRARDAPRAEPLPRGWPSARRLPLVEPGRHPDQDLDYYSQYLELNPGAVAVRRNIAYSLATEADNPEAALAPHRGGDRARPEPDIDLPG